MKTPRPRAAAPVLAVLLLGSAACGAGGHGRSAGGRESAAGARQACAGLPGGRGTDLATTDGLDSARRQFSADARSWEPHQRQVPDFTASEVCRVVVKGQKPHRDYLSLRYGASIFPFDSRFGHKAGIYDAESVISVGDDVKLVTWKPRGPVTDYSVFVRCRVPDAPRGQEDGVPVEGSLTDNLTRDTAAHPHLKDLLHSAAAVTKFFDCRNKPRVPTDVPAGE